MKKDIRIHITKYNELYINDILIDQGTKECVNACKRIINMAVEKLVEFTKST